MVYFKETYNFPGSSGGPTFSLGSPTFAGESNVFQGGRTFF